MSKIVGCVIAVFCFLPADLIAQNEALIDSLEGALTQKVGKERLNCMVDFAIQFVDRDNEKAFVVTEHAASLALKLGDSLLIARCLRIKGQVLSRLQRLEEAIEMLQASLEISERQRFDQERLQALISYGVICVGRSEYDKGLRKFMIAHDLAAALKDTVFMEAALNNLGVVYYKLKDYSKALRYWKASVESQRYRNARSFKEHLNMSLAYANLQDFKNARQTLSDCIVLCGDDCPDEALVHINYASGVIFLGLKDYEKGKLNLITSYRLSKKTRNDRMLLDNIYLLADVYLKQERIDLALSYLKEGENIINRGVEFNLETIKIYRRFADLYLALENFRMAAFYQSKYINLKDSIYNENLTTSLMKAEASYLERHNRAQIASQNELITLKEEIISRQQKGTLSAVLLALVTVVCCLFLYWNYRIKKAMNRRLEERIRTRTYELECNRSELLLALNERELIIRRVQQEAIETISTIKGLCNTAKAEHDQRVAYLYLQKIERTLGRLKGQLCALLGEGQFLDEFDDISSGLRL